MLLKPLLFEAILALLASEVLQQLPVSSYPQLIIATRSFIIKQSPFKRCLDSTLRPMLEFLRMAFAGQELGLIILVVPFQPKVFYDSMNLHRSFK